jgi:hypothetical protein
MTEQEKVAYENAKDYLYYGYSKKERIENWHNADLNEEDSNRIWKKAFENMASDF